MSDFDIDSDIERAEKAIGSLSIGEASLKLVVTTARLTDNVQALSNTVSSLTLSVSTLAQDVNGVQGVRAELRDVRYKINSSDEKIKGISDRIDSAMVIVWRAIWFLVVVGIVTTISDIRNLAPLLMEGTK